MHGGFVGRAQLGEGLWGSLWTLQPHFTSFCSGGGRGGEGGLPGRGCFMGRSGARVEGAVAGLRNCPEVGSGISGWLREAGGPEQKGSVCEEMNARGEAGELGGEDGKQVCLMESGGSGWEGYQEIWEASSAQDGARGVGRVQKQGVRG